MIKQYSTIKHDPANNKFGDCHRACIASILEVSIHEVPHFFENYSDELSGELNNNMQTWLKDNHNLIQISIPIKVDENFSHLEKVLNTCNYFTYGLCHYILTGTSIRGFGHSVICKGDKIVHDPTYYIGTGGEWDYSFFVGDEAAAGVTHGMLKPIYDEVTEEYYWWFKILTKV